MDDRIRPYVIVYKEKFGNEALQYEYTKFCTLKELVEEIGMLYKEPFITSIMYYEITEEE